MSEINRRNFVRNSALSAAGLLLGSNLAAFPNEQGVLSSQPAQGFDLMKEVMKYRKIDAYANVPATAAAAKTQIEYADLLGIERLIIAVPIAKKMGEKPEEFREYNNQVLGAVKRYPNRLAGQLTLHPAYLKESLEEIKRCVDAGMVGMKLYNQVKINDPLYFPVIEKFIDHKMIIHVHGESQLGVGGYRMKYDVKNTPTISLPDDFVDVAKRYPEAMFQYAHLGGGSDWEYACKSFTDYSNIYVDTGGSNNEEYLVNFAVQCLGEDRVFFGCDSSFFQGIGKILSADLSTAQKEKIFFGNYNAVLKKSGRNF